MEKQTLVKDKPVRLIKLFNTMSDIYTDCIQYGSKPTVEHMKKAYSIKGQWSELFSDNEQIKADTFSSLENVIASGLTNTKKGSDIVKAFNDLIGESVFAELNNWLNIYIYICGQRIRRESF